MKYEHGIVIESFMRENGRELELIRDNHTCNDAITRASELFIEWYQGAFNKTLENETLYILKTLGDFRLMSLENLQEIQEEFEEPCLFDDSFNFNDDLINRVDDTLYSCSFWDMRRGGITPREINDNIDSLEPCMRALVTNGFDGDGFYYQQFTRDVASQLLFKLFAK